MDVRAMVDLAIDGYHGDALEMVLIGSDHWNGFLAQTKLVPSTVGANDREVVYRSVACRQAISPDAIKLVTGD